MLLILLMDYWVMKTIYENVFCLFVRNLMTQTLSRVCYASSVLMVLYAMVSVYRVSYFVSAILVLLAVSALTSKDEAQQKEVNLEGQQKEKSI